MLLPTFYLKGNLEKLSNLEKGMVGWKIFITYKYLDAAKEKAPKLYLNHCQHLIVCGLII